LARLGSYKLSNSTTYATGAPGNYSSNVSYMSEGKRGFVPSQVASTGSRYGLVLTGFMLISFTDKKSLPFRFVDLKNSVLLHRYKHIDKPRLLSSGLKTMAAEHDLVCKSLGNLLWL
jgi:hypothetical protein